MSAPATIALDPQVRELAQQLRVDSIRSTTAAGSGHPTSSMSAADLMAVLLARHLRYDFSDPRNPNNDHLIFSKGHASPLVYAVFKAVGVITDAEMLTFRQFGSILGKSSRVWPPRDSVRSSAAFAVHSETVNMLRRSSARCQPGLYRRPPVAPTFTPSK